MPFAGGWIWGRVHPPRQIRLALPEPLASEVRAAIAEQGGLGIEEVDDAWVAIGPDPSAVVWVALVASREEAEAAVAQGAGAVVAWPDTLGLLPSALELAFQQGADRVGHEVMRQAVRSSPAWLEVTGLDLRWLEVSQGFTEGSGYDTAIALILNCTELACDDDGGTGLLSSITWNVTAGVTYHISVEGWNGATGAFNLNIN